MAELTKEYLDNSLKNLATKQDVQNIVDGAVDTLARIVKTGFDHVETTLAVLEQGQEDIRLNLDQKVNKIDLPGYKNN